MRTTSGPRRRAVLLGGILGGAVLAGGAAVFAHLRSAGSQSVAAARRALRLPRPGGEVPVVPEAATPVQLADKPALTPVADFFLIDTTLSAPQVDPGTWRLQVDGRVDKKVTLTLDELLAMPSVERVLTLSCVSNPVGGDLVGTATWQGVLLADVLKLAGIGSGATQLTSTSADGWVAGFPVELALDGRDALIAYAMNGEPLTVEHGFPVRLVVPGLYGYVSATKWLTRITLSAEGEHEPYWIARGWTPDGTAGAVSKIDTPRTRAKLNVGAVVMAGRAWHPHVGVAAVEIKVDDAAWQRAILAEGMGTDAWRLWTYPWQATAGTHEVWVRMISGDGSVQPGVTVATYPGAAEGWHHITLQVGA